MRRLSLIIVALQRGGVAIGVDTFEQVNQAAMMAAWPMIGKRGTHLQLTSDDALKRSGNKVEPMSPTHACFEPLGESGRSLHLRSIDPTNGINGTDKEPLYFSFDIWLAPGSNKGKPNVSYSQRHFTLASWDNDNVFSFGPISQGGLDDTKWAFGQTAKKGGVMSGRS